MGTMEETPGAAAAEPVSAQEIEPFSCKWDQLIREAGIEHEQSFAIRIGVPVLALCMLVASLVVAFVAPDAGRSVAPLAVGLVLAAGFPWAHWLVRGDRGPTWDGLLLMLGPVLALGIGQWFVDEISLGSSVAYPLLAFPGLLLVVLGLAVAEDVSMVVGIIVASYLSYGGPLLAAWAWDRDVDPAGVVTWHVGFALAVVAGYAVRLSYQANLAVSEAREAMARQEAAAERRRVARDVHDVVAHTLAVTMLHMTAARMAAHRGSLAEAESALAEAERHGRASLADIRRMVRLMRSDESSGVDSAQPGLADIEGLVDGYRAAGLPVELSFSISSQYPSPSAELAVFRVLQEALTNAARHGSGQATVELRIVGDEMSLQVDNPFAVRPSQLSRGSGLVGMRERIAAAGGTIETGIRNGHWVVRAVVPTGVAA